MKIITKLILGFTVVILLILLLGYLSVQISQNALRNAIGEKNVHVTEQLLHKIEMRVYKHIDVFKEFSADPTLHAGLRKANVEFASLPDITTVLDNRDIAWSDSSEYPTPVASTILSNTVSLKLRDKILFYYQGDEEKRIYGEVFITNRYGAIFAMSGKTTDYRQDDEEWWQEAVSDGYSIGKIGYDESAELNSLAVALRIDGDDGEFLGVLKIVMNIDFVVGLIKEFEQQDVNRDVDIKLLTGYGRIVYSTKVDSHFNDIDEGSLFSTMTANSGYITAVTASTDGSEAGEELFIYTHSAGFEDSPGLGWVMIIEYDSKDAFAAVASLKEWLIIIISIVTILALLMSSYISSAISRPLVKLKAASSELGQCDFSTRIEVDSNDEMCEIASNFNDMAERLETVMAERDKEVLGRKSSEETVSQLAYYDQLTGLPNRNLFIDRIDHMIERDLWRKRLAALFFLDLDRFKVVNDTLGRADGDKLIQAVAERLKFSLRDGDVVARLGGDEFGILLQDLARAEDLPMVVEKVFDSFRDPLVLSDEEVNVSGCIGISIFPHDGDSAAILLKNAEIAMYRAKGDGKNMYRLFSPSMALKSREVLRIESVLDTAVERDQLVLHYQPQLSLETGKITGTESLVRLKDPDGGLIPPGKFIDLAEETGLIVKISRWVLNKACSQGKEWHDEGIEKFNVSVNISARMFNQADLIDTIASALSKSGFPPEYLDLEITESVVMADADEAIKKMHKLKELGVKFSVDDFGTGYSSLSYMKHMPIDMLKIDRSFVIDIMKNETDMAIMKAIISMAHSLGIEVIAEGVEERDQLDLLIALGCDKIQGYYFSKPVAASEHTVMLLDGSGLDMKKKVV